MPLYEYQCEKCGDLFEVIQKFADTPIAKHEKCGGSVRRLLSAPALVFKGSGFYVNDYAKKSRSGSGTSPNGSSDKGDSSSSGKNDSGSAKNDKSGSGSGSSSGSSNSDSGSSTTASPGTKADTKSS